MGTLREAGRFRTARREALRNEVPLAGAQCVAKLIKADVIDRYSVRTTAHIQTDDSCAKLAAHARTHAHTHAHTHTR